MNILLGHLEQSQKILGMAREWIEIYFPIKQSDFLNLVQYNEDLEVYKAKYFGLF